MYDTYVVLLPAGSVIDVRNLDNITDADGNNSDGTILDEKDGKGNPILTFGYNAFAQRTTVTDAIGNTTTYSFDAIGRVTSKQDPGGNCSATPPTGCTAYGYDAANQLTSITFSDGLTPNVSAIKYDANGDRIAATDGTGTSGWAWDSLRRLVAYTNGNGAQLQWVYNLRNLPVTILYPGSLSVTEAYDNAGRWSSVQDWNANLTTFGYDANSNLTTETFPSASGVVDTFTFNNADHMIAAASKKGKTTLFSATYTRDAANQLASDTSAASGTGSYKYTPLNELCYAGSSNTSACSTPPSGIAYKYDAADNLVQNGVSQQQAFNNADELCWTAPTANACATPPSGASTYQYDLRGNRTGFNPNGAQAQTFTYDQANRISSFTVSGSTTTYGYNADGLRMCKLAASAATPCTSPSATQFVWDAVRGNLIQDGSTRYVYGPGGLPLEQVTTSATNYFHHDQSGSTRLVTSSSGANQATYTFNPFGKLVASTGSLVNPFLYTGQYFDTETGLYYLRARYYDPSTAQFLTRDPLTASTREPYGYLNNSPMNGSDPSGKDGLWDCHEIQLGPFAWTYCPGQEPGGGQVPSRPSPRPSPSPTPEPTQTEPCSCSAALQYVGGAELELTVSSNWAISAVYYEINWIAADKMFEEVVPWGIIYSRGFETGIGGPNERIFLRSTADLGSGRFFAWAEVIVRLVNGEECVPAEANAKPWSQTGSPTADY